MSEFAKKYRELLEERKGMVEVFYNEPIWEKFYELLCNNMSETINFLEEECTEDEFFWLSEIFLEVTEKSKSKEFIETLYKLAKKYPKVTKKRDMYDFIEEAEGHLE